MALNWNEINDITLNLSKEWANNSNEGANAKPFLVKFLSDEELNNNSEIGKCPNCNSSGYLE